jgi:predicted nuclease of predicted toxin-antitoxin system
MRLKLDENLGHRAREILDKAGHNVSTVFTAGLGAAIDDAVLKAATGDNRALVTLDLDFSSPLRFIPSKYSGIVVLRPRSKPSLGDILTVIRTLARFLEKDQPMGKLWIVEPGRVRVYQEPLVED